MTLISERCDFTWLEGKKVYELVQKGPPRQPMAAFIAVMIPGV